MKYLDNTVLNAAMPYESYRKLIDDLLAENRTTSEAPGFNTPAMLEYSKLNVARMNRLDKTGKLGADTLEKLSQINQAQTWLVITEGWCGDAAQIVPILQKMAAANSNIQLRFILRDENPEVMAAFLTQGSRSIPKVIILDTETLEVLGDWGPRPSVAQAMVMAAKEEMENMTDKALKAQRYEELKTTLHSWYAQDKTRLTQQEFLDVLVALPRTALQTI